MRTSLARATTWVSCVVLFACGGLNSNGGGVTLRKDGGGVLDTADGGPSSTCVPHDEACDGLDNDCDGVADEDYDLDGDGRTSCGGDCDDQDPTVYPGAAEVLNDRDDNCDGKVDERIAGHDFDGDGTPYPEDCNDEEPLVGPRAVEVAGDSVDNNCDGNVDEALEPCDGKTGSSAADFAKALGLCSSLTSAQFVGNAASRSLRTSFGTEWKPKEGAKMAMLSSGEAVDRIEEPSYVPQRGKDFNTSTSHPLYTAPRCAKPASTPAARDLSELKLTLQVPQNAHSLSFQFNFFSAEYPEYVCTRYNDRFIVLLESAGIDKTKLPPGQCLASSTTPTCNISYDSAGQPVTVNNGFFDICVPFKGPGWENKCTQSPNLLAGTGYDVADPDYRIVGGATGWLTTKAPVKPGEVITLRFLVFDEGDAFLDSAVLLDDFKWEATAVSAPVTESSGLN